MSCSGTDDNEEEDDDDDDDNDKDDNSVRHVLAGHFGVGNHGHGYVSSCADVCGEWSGSRNKADTDGYTLERFSSIEGRTPTSPHPPGGNDQHQIYSVQDYEDNVFSDEKPKFGDVVPPTPGTAEYAPHLKAGWSKRKLTRRDIIFILIGVVLLVGLAVGAAVAVILVNEDYSSSSYSPLLALTSPSATTASTTQASTSLSKTTSTLVEDIHYDGHLVLSSPWKTTVVELEHLFVNDMEAIIAASPLYKSFIKSSLLNVSENEKLTFTLDFRRTLLEIFNASDEIIDNSLARTVQTILREKVVTNAGNIKLPIKAETIIILENIPVSTSTIAPSTMPVSASTEAETKGPCLSMTFEPCHSLLGSSYFYLPNLLQHKTSHQAEDAFRELSRHPMNSSCSDFSFLYLCSMLFPVCDSKSGVPIFPCDTLCQAVVNECGILKDWPQNCEEFPKDNCRASDIKSTSKPSSTSTVTSTKTSPKSSVASTKTAISSTSVSTSTANHINYQCVPFSFKLCNDLGFMETVLPSPIFQCSDIQCLTEKFLSISSQSMEKGCTNDLSFFCAYTFRGCNMDNLLDPIGPCFDNCNDIVQHCGSFLPQRIDCSEFNHPNKRCISSTITTMSPTTLPPSDSDCIDQTYSFCVNEGFLRTTRKTLFGDTLEQGIAAFESFAMPVIQSRCSELAKFFYCGVFFPKCENKKSSYPCQSVCNEVNSQCESAAFSLECSFLVDDEHCLKPSQISTTSVPNRAFTSTSVPTKPVTSTPVPTRPVTSSPKSQCEPLKSQICSQFGYTHTSFPNLWGDKSDEEANKTYYKVAERYVAAGCSTNILFYICSVLFPFCEGDGTLKLPCTSYCEEVNAGCFDNFKQSCDILSDSQPGQCLAPPPRLACADSEFECANINKCVPSSAVCNRQNDCGDWSDERTCTCNEFEIQCAMGLCIPSYHRCDKSTQCPDNSDESDCECPMNQYKCEHEDKCIMPEWLCDGYPDCSNEDDESFCHNCTKDEFMCLDNVCIPSSQECDGTPQCADHSDEMNCIFEGGPNNPFFMKLNPDYLMTCYDGFTQAHGQTACLKMGQASLKSWTSVVPGNYVGFFHLDQLGDRMSVIGRGRIVSNCPTSTDAVAIECNLKECGRPNKNLPSLIINGKNALAGSWPWMVSLRKDNAHVCGGSIIHPYFILTAAHCFEGSASLDYSHIKVVAGTSRLSQKGQEKVIRRIISHPEYKHLGGNDIAILQLKEPLEYNDFVKPLCFPEEEDVFTRANRCYIAGWGHTKGVGGQNSEHQQETKMTLWDTEKCNSSYMWNGRVLANEMCAGYFNGLIAACSGDSGSPVVCQDETETWKAVGVASYVYKTCSVATKPMVFTPTKPYVNWINNHTLNQFTCDNGISLFDKGMLCDTVDDCGDKSDEINLCDVRANCSFNDRFLCGYQSTWQLVSSAGQRYVNRFPLFDHTKGGYPGMYLLGRTRGDDDIKSPRIDLTTPHCMRFHYHMRGNVQQGMAVSVHDLDKPWIEAWNLSRTTGPDKWLMGMFNLGPGHYDIVFRPHDNRRFAVDDIWLIEGTCETMSCLEGEFMCVTFKSKNCLPLEVRCNIVVDCDNGEDEKDCPAPAYLCDFENGNVCGLEQHTDDTVESEWLMVNSSSMPINLPDHTFANASGTALKVNTEMLLESDQVLMSQELNLDNTEHCLKFYYASTSPVTLQVVLKWNKMAQTVIKFTNRKTVSWILTQATLPALGKNIKTRLVYEVIGGMLGSGTVEQAIMLDDISITRGQCPSFTCPAGSLLCEGEAFCVPAEHVCDRTPNCNKGTDEINCECNATEFKCPYGSCIPKMQVCNLVENCPDGSDEGVICDHKRSVNCDFEDSFICGYRVNTSGNTFHWDRAEGKTGDPHTGPSNDHTSLVKGGVNGFYIVADDQHDGDFTSLQSIPFISLGHGLVFYYHARHYLYTLYMTGRLTLFVTFMSNGTQKELWSTVPDNNDEWKLMCLELPKGNISISFVVQRGSGTHADIALDDIQLLDTSCDMFSKSGRIVNIQQTTSRSIISPGCKETERACRNQMCIDANLFCDKVRDCPDGFDEFDCDV